MLQTPRERIALGVGVVVIAGLSAAGYVERDRIFPPKAPPQEADAGGLKIPTIDEMCKTLGVTASGDLKKCQEDERDAGEFVIAWMNLNNFMVNGEISLEQIQLISDLGGSDATSGFGSDALGGLDGSAGGLDPSTSDSQITAGIDPLTGAPLGYLKSPADLALYCLQMAGDWVTMHDCISENDPSSSIGGGGP